MKKSQIYRMAQVAVIESEAITDRVTQLIVLKELMEKEELELFKEQQAEKGAE